MEWKVVARVYGDTRRKLCGMSQEDFSEYRVRWEPRTVRGVQEGGADQDKWIGFRDALRDEYAKRQGATAPEADAWLDEVLHYLYEEQEKPHGT